MRPDRSNHGDDVHCRRGENLVFVTGEFYRRKHFFQSALGLRIAIGAGQALGRHPDVDCIAFTGSTATGKRFMEYSGQSNLKRAWIRVVGSAALILIVLLIGGFFAVIGILCFNRRELATAQGTQ